MQRAYITALYELMERDHNVVSLLSDSGTDYDAMLSRDFPTQCYNFGIAEQNKVAAASGMAAVGKIPFVYTTGTFIAYRAYEFVRDDVCLQNRNVKMVGIGMGLSGLHTLGPSHHSTEDIAVLRAIPNLTLLCAATPIELKRCVEAAYSKTGPVYIRMGMSGEEELYDDGYTLDLGKPTRLMEGQDIVLFATGTLVAEALRAAKALVDDGLSVGLFDVHTLKPMDMSAIVAAVKMARHVFTVEEHNIIGGLGSAISEIIAEKGMAIPLTRIGLKDMFAKGYGTPAELRKLNGLDADSIYQKCKDNLL